MLVGRFVSLRRHDRRWKRFGFNIMAFNKNRTKIYFHVWYTVVGQNQRNFGGRRPSAHGHFLPASNKSEVVNGQSPSLSFFISYVPLKIDFKL